MASLTQAQLSFLFRQEWLIQFGLANIFHGGRNCYSIYMTLMHISLGVYATLIAFLMYFFCECPGNAQPSQCTNVR
jgi:hypothetical protein